MKITAEIEVEFDDGDPDILECELEADEIADEIQGAVSGCTGISDVASVEVKKLTLSTSDRHSITKTLPGKVPTPGKASARVFVRTTKQKEGEQKCSTTPNSRSARSAAAASTRTRKARNRTT